MRAKPGVISVAGLALVTMVAASCASPSGDGPSSTAPGASPSAASPANRCQRLFISPSGEPFRRAPGGACPLAVWFADADADHDGALSRTEFKDDAARFFAILDVDKDGVLEPDEVQRYERDIAPEILGRPHEAAISGRLVLVQFGGGGGGGGMGGRGGGGRRRKNAESGRPRDAGQGASPDGASRYSLLDEPEPVASADMNFDGRITHAEFMERASQRFDSLDADDSGHLTLPEVEARLAMRTGGRAGPGPGARRRRST